mgnify:CR=1 FL=1
MAKKTSVSTRKRRQKKSEKKSLFKKIFFIGLFFCLAGVFGYFAFFWPSIWIEEIKIEFEKDTLNLEDQVLTIAEKHLGQNYLKFLPQKSFFLVPLETIQASILKEIPQLAEVEVSKELKLSNNEKSFLKIKAHKRQIKAVWCQSFWQEEEKKEEEVIETFSKKNIKDCFYIDSNGVIFKEAPQTRGGLIFSIYDFRQKEPQLGQVVIEPSLMEKILIIQKDLINFSSQNKLFNLASFEIDSVRKLVVLTDQGWRIYFSIWQPVEEQLRVLKRSLLEEIKDTNQIKEYLDLRTPNRLYYK